MAVPEPLFHLERAAAPLIAAAERTLPVALPTATAKAIVADQFQGLLHRHLFPHFAKVEQHSCPSEISGSFYLPVTVQVVRTSRRTPKKLRISSVYPTCPDTSGLSEGGRLVRQPIGPVPRDVDEMPRVPTLRRWDRANTQQAQRII